MSSIRNLWQRASQMLLYTGLLSLAFGIVVFLWPGVTLRTLVWLFAILVFVHGFSHVRSGIQFRKDEYYWWVLMLLGILYIAGGLFSIIFPEVTAGFVMMVMGITWFSTGLVQVIGAIRLRKEILNEGWLILAGLVSVAAGIYVFMEPGKGALGMLRFIALYAVTFGILMIVFGVRARGWLRYDEKGFLPR